MLIENNKQKFCQDILTKLPCPLEYFAGVAVKNRSLMRELNEIVDKSINCLIDVEEFEKDRLSWVVLDTRDPELLVQGFIPGTISIPLKNANFEMWVA
jgi:hypothetical protein